MFVAAFTPPPSAPTVASTSLGGGIWRDRHVERGKGPLRIAHQRLSTFDRPSLVPPDHEPDDRKDQNADTKQKLLFQTKLPIVAAQPPRDNSRKDSPVYTGNEKIRSVATYNQSSQ